MLINHIINYCHDSYINKADCDCRCNYKQHCPNGHCERCLHYIHTPTDAPAERKYDCPNMANFYTCKYAYKYMSEIVYALRQLKDLRNKKHIKIMSVCCGPCTELFAFDFLKEIGEYTFDTIEYRGIDPARDVWANVHRQIKEYNKELYTAKFYYADVMALIDEILQVDWVPNVIIFQYVFSDMHKNSSKAEVTAFIEKLSIFINDKMESNTYIVLNDINLSIDYKGGREYFDILLNKINSSAYLRWHFDNSNKARHYNYGEEYATNCLVAKTPKILNSYNPFDSCASAQMIIKKVINNDN